jgi:hypothetical protein
MSENLSMAMPASPAGNKGSGELRRPKEVNCREFDPQPCPEAHRLFTLWRSGWLNSFFLALIRD